MNEMSPVIVDHLPPMTAPRAGAVTLIGNGSQGGPEKMMLRSPMLMP